MVKNNFDKEYHKLLQFLLNKGNAKDDRTGTGTISHFGYQMRFDLSEGFPLITTKKVFLKGIIHELIWFLKGETNIKYLVDNNVKIWNEWPFMKYLEKTGKENEFKRYSEEWNKELEWYANKIKTDEKFAKRWGKLGPVYGSQWRCFKAEDGQCFDQIRWIINEIKTNPNSRRLIVNAWHAAKVEDMALPPCHTMFQFYVQDNKLSCQLYQRSADVFLGVPFNIASYALLTIMVAHICDLELGEFVHTFGDVHIYKNHINQVKEQISRKSFSPPKIKINPKVKDILKFKFEDFELIDYESHPSIKAPIAV